MLRSEQFFDLTQFSHKNLFDPEAYVWKALLYLTSYLKAQHLGKIEIAVPKNCHLIHPELISIGKGTKIDPEVMIEGPCIIGKHCQIRHGAFLRPNVLLGDHCVVGHATEMKHSILLDGAAAPHFNYVGDSILGIGVNLGAGVILANYRLDQQEIFMFYKGEKIFSGLKKFGAVIGDGSKLGCNSVTNPGTLLPKNYRCSPCTNVKGIINEKSKLRI
ncbi:MAG: glucose-1-phosphate thymidylyltransferase [Simkaniaceae bacterium]